MNYQRPGVLAAFVVLAIACGSTSRSNFDDSNDPTQPGTIAPGTIGEGGTPANTDLGRDPITCDEAKLTRSYVGCDYWPTINANNVFQIFDYAVVVANTGTSAADVTVTGGAGGTQTVTVQPGTLEKVYLPWVKDLKGSDATSLGGAVAMTASVVSKGGAYHLVASAPVVVYQFSPLEYKGEGGPSGKSWASCPNISGGCFSYSNDASLLLPSTAWTQSYRVTGVKGWSSGGPLGDVMGAYATITAGADGTHVSIALGAKGNVLAGGGIPQTNGGGTLSITLDAGDVAEVVGPIGQNNDLSGSLVTSDKPVQVMTGIPCIDLPQDQSACDHVEESVVPAEALGKRYVVTTPTAPKGGTGKHFVRFYGNRDGTVLTYTPSMPTGCPPTLNAGSVFECSGMVGQDFVVEGTQEFGVSSFMVGSSVYDPSGDDPRGDPSQTSFAAIEQFRTSYLFLAPSDYDVSYAVIVGPSDAAPVLDGSNVGSPVTISPEMSVWRVTLGAGKNGAHTLTSTKAVGLQVMGYGSYTSYQYPGGLNLTLISPPPASPH